MNYKSWIEENYGTLEASMGRCKEACEHMKSVFPELQITNGFVTLAFVGAPQMHWWLKDPEGNIVDPTKYQYCTPAIEYEEINDDHPARNYRRAKCMNCGEYYYEIGPVMHNAQCEKEFTDYLNKDIFDNV